MRGVEAVAGWVLDHDLATPAGILETAGEAWARRVLVGLERTADEELDAIFSTTANVLEAYSTEGGRAARGSRNEIALLLETELMSAMKISNA